MKKIQNILSVPGKYAISLIVAGLCVALAGAAFGSGSSCVNCHSDRKFISTNKKLYSYYLRWEHSVHANEGVTCTDCHAGDPQKSDKDAAHGYAAGHDKVTLSAVYYSNIPDTCSKCHQEIVADYKKSKHYEYLTKDNLLEVRGANCVTCHNMGMTAADGNHLLERAVSSCTICHNYKSRNYPDIPARAQSVLVKFVAAKRQYSNLVIQHHNQLSEQIKGDFASALLSLTASLHALNLDKVEADTTLLLKSMKEVRRKLRKGIVVELP